MGEYKSNSYAMKDKRNNDTPNKKVEKEIMIHQTRRLKK